MPLVSEPVSQDGREVTEEEYWRDYYFESDVHYEWNNGRLEEKPVSDYGTFLVYAWFTELLRHFLRARPGARMVALEMGFRLALPTGTVIRKPDLGVLRDGNPVPLQPLDASYRGVFDLCIEALSDKDRRGIARDAVTKRAEYAAGGVSEYYILHREPERQVFYARTAAGIYVPIVPVAGVIGSRVLPGFQFRLDDLLTQPSPEAMRHDPVYAQFVLPGWREAEERAAAAMQQAQAQAQAEAQARAVAEQGMQQAIAAREAAEAARAQAEDALARLKAELANRG
ncbi:Uma2 family endonuclease [Candidatus Thiodictyon syntrophicum]|jgi:hypothetical protein|nr:Uma2 family endonuclease [Candidatus Thiodictyon syntrophicum]